MSEGTDDKSFGLKSRELSCAIRVGGRHSDCHNISQGIIPVLTQPNSQ